MPRPSSDVSRARCRVCQKPLLPNEARYTIADEWDYEEETNTNVLLVFEHHKCHMPLDKALDKLRGRIRDVENLAAEMKKRGL